jgi:hypothetical protein
MQAGTQRAQIDLLPLLREEYQRDGVNAYCGHYYYGSEGYAYFAKTAAGFLPREPISG